MPDSVSRPERLDRREQIETAVPETSRVLRRAYELYFGRLGLTLSQAMLIGNLDLSERHMLNQTELSQIVGLRKAATGTAIDGLVARGLVSRSSDPNDRRAKLLSLTPQGTTMARAVDQAFGELAAVLRRGISPDRRRALVTTLATMRQNVEALVADQEDWAPGESDAAGW